MRRSLALAAMVALLSSSVGVFPSSERAHACTDHVCFCRGASAPAPPPDAPCHAATSKRATTALQSTCDHDQDPAAGGSAAEAVVLTASTFAWAATSERLASPAGALPHLRAAVPETPPPRSASC